MKVYSQKNYRVSIMKLICAFMVVAIHSQFLYQDHISWWIREFVPYGICSMAVPFFFVISGYYLAKHFDEPGWFLRELKKRFWSLAVPYITLVTLFIVLSYGMEGYFDRGLKILLIDFGVHPLVCPLLVPMWYIRALIALVLLSPLIRYTINKRSRAVAIAFLCALGIACFIGRPYSECSNTRWYLFFSYGLSLQGLFYFSIGAFLRKYPLSHPSPAAGVMCLVLGIALFALRTYLLVDLKHVWLASHVGFFAIPVLMAGVYALLPDFQLSSMLENASFPVYGLHLFLLALIGGRISRGGRMVCSRSFFLSCCFKNYCGIYCLCSYRAHY